MSKVRMFTDRTAVELKIVMNTTNWLEKARKSNFLNMGIGSNLQVQVYAWSVTRG